MTLSFPIHSSVGIVIPPNYPFSFEPTKYHASTDFEPTSVQHLLAIQLFIILIRCGDVFADFVIGGDGLFMCL